MGSWNHVTLKETIFRTVGNSVFYTKQCKLWGHFKVVRKFNQQLESLSHESTERARHF